MAAIYLGTAVTERLRFALPVKHNPLGCGLRTHVQSKPFGNPSRELIVSLAFV
jgi:hypothetical protein